MPRLALGLPILLAASTSFALPRPNSAVRSGANHHLGDDSYVAKHGHAPGADARERERMHDHLSFVRDWLASRPATKPELETRRAEILGDFDAYIAKYTTPKNDHVPWRTPVFIDDEGTICAVGYLIQQSVNPDLPKKIAKLHRYDFIEDIARDMPEVKAWVDGSGFTLDEIASIQPAYTEPRVNTWRTWDLAKHTPVDGLFDKFGARGVFRHGEMEGPWVAYHKVEKTGEEVVVGRGKMQGGDGPWTSFYDDGKTLAEGQYADNRAEGNWTLYHHSGNVAAEGAFAAGDRTGRWHFYYDTPAKTPIAIGRFAGRGTVVGTWKHFDQEGKLLARTWTETPNQWAIWPSDGPDDVDSGDGFMLDIVARPGEVKHVSHTGTVNQRPLALDMYAFDGERIYIHKDSDGEIMYDQNGWELTHADGAWRAADCGWNAKRKTYARRGDLAPLHGALYADTHRRNGSHCGAALAVSSARADTLDMLVATRDKVRALTPEFIRDAVLGEEGGAEVTDSDRERMAKLSDMTRVLEENMSEYLEWPHVDGLFVEAFGTMPGRFTRSWAGGDPESDGDD
jgi:antitoxin component YwqK of YwqJK toxin-antitoxin module